MWRKDVARDGIGNPDFDRIALTESRMVPDQARDTYRLGKSLRKKGFDTAGFREELDAIAGKVNEQIRLWIDADSTVEIETEGPHLTDMRSLVLPRTGGDVPDRMWWHPRHIPGPIGSGASALRNS